ncbi:hypothetical protein [Brachybacterium sacelli]|uniref:hypothetical protein n=1 Tax=Brachybacterium sacelli TaxID=173364 RepID=UPI003617820F
MTLRSAHVVPSRPVQRRRRTPKHTSRSTTGALHRVDTSARTSRCCTWTFVPLPRSGTPDQN